MALEAEGGSFGVAINTGTDGDLSRTADWQIVSDVQRMPEHACPAFRYDPMHGDYYLTGGGETHKHQGQRQRPAQSSVTIVNLSLVSHIMIENMVHPRMLPRCE